MPADKPAAVLFDFDGTLVNTEPCWMAEEQAIVHRHGGEWTLADSHAVMGQSPHHVAQLMIDRFPDPEGVDLEQLVQEWISAVIERVRQTPEEEIWMPGAWELLAEVQAQGIPVGLVTTSPRRCVEPIAERLGEHPFDAVVTADDVTRLKPDPMPYLRAAELLGVDPHECIVLEDSATGARAGLAAGCTVIRVHPGDDDSGAHHRLDGLADVHFDDLMTLWQSA